MFKLTIEDDEGKTTVIPLIRDEMTIGRQEGNTIRLTERNVSRKHARLLRQNGTLFIEDLTSFTGVKVNGAKIAASTPVREGDQVQIGDYKLMVRAERPAVAPVEGDRATMPVMPATLAPGPSSGSVPPPPVPMGTVGGSVAIPTRATPAMAVPAPGLRPNSSPSIPAVALPATVTAPLPTTIAALAASAAAASAAVTALGMPEMLEAQPTIPVRTLGEAPQPPPPQADAAPPARLVVLTTELAGLEFALSRGALVIGRTDENEIVLNHRSISRHHAKVVREGDRYTIVDLQSANGVRVNSEDYERIELHAGDLVELGHVKLRFVGPFEHYVFDPKARHDRGRFSTKTVMGAGGGLLALVAIFLVWKMRPHDGDAALAEATAAPPAAVAAAAPPSAKPPTPTPTSAASQALAAPPSPAAAGEAAGAGAATPQVLLAEAARAAGSEDWDAARASLDRLGTQLADPAVRKQAMALGKRVDLERQGALAFGRFDEAQSSKNYASAVARYDDIPGDSVYKKRAQGRFEEARAVLVNDHLTAAERARNAGRCADLKQEADEVMRLDSRNTFVKEMVRLCRPQHGEAPVAVASRAPRPKASLAAAAAPAPRAAAAERQERQERVDSAPAKAAVAAAEPDLDVDVLMKQAREAWVRQQCGAALDLSRKALRAKPGMTDAYQIIAACSCSLKDADGANRAYAKLDDKSRNLVHTLCQRNGIAVGE